MFYNNLGKTLFWISCIWNIVQTWLLVRPFVYLSSFISQILDFLYWMVCIFIFIASQWKQRMNYLDDEHTITAPMINVVLNSCHIYLSRAWESLKTQQCMKSESCFIVFRTEKGYSKNCPCYNHYSHNFVGQLPVLEIHQKLLVLLCMRLFKCIILLIARFKESKELSSLLEDYFLVGSRKQLCKLLWWPETNMVTLFWLRKDNFRLCQAGKTNRIVY